MLQVVATAPMCDVWRLVTLAAESCYYSVPMGLIRAPTAAPTIVIITIRVTFKITQVKL